MIERGRDGFPAMIVPVDSITGTVNTAGTVQCTGIHRVLSCACCAE